MGLLKSEISGDSTAVKTVLEREGDFDFADYRRASSQVRCVMLAVASVSRGDMSRWAVIGWNGAGCSQENRVYWDDYVAAGRESARASLFVPTLPSISVCEAAIAVGAHGECCYYRTAADTGLLAEIVEDMFSASRCLDGVVVVESRPGAAVAIALKRGEKLPGGFKTLKEVH